MADPDEDFPEDDPREWLDGCRTRQEKIRAAIGVLWFEDDWYWEPTGVPRIKAVEQLSNLSGITREEIERAAPGYTRTHAEAHNEPGLTTTIH